MEVCQWQATVWTGPCRHSSLLRSITVSNSWARRLAKAGDFDASASIAFTAMATAECLLLYRSAIAVAPCPEYCLKWFGMRQKA